MALGGISCRYWMVEAVNKTPKIGASLQVCVYYSATV
jgi:hypothetical protein